MPAEIIDLLEYKKKKEEEEIESLKAQLRDIAVIPPESMPYYMYSIEDGPYYTYDSSGYYTSPQFDKGSYGTSVTTRDEREYLFSDLWHVPAEEDHNEWE